MISSHVATSGVRLGPEIHHSSSLRLGSADAALALGLPAIGTGSGNPSAHTAMAAAAAAAEPVETHHSDEFAAPESRIVCCLEQQKQSLNRLHGPTWQGSHSKEDKK